MIDISIQHKIDFATKINIFSDNTNYLNFRQKIDYHDYETNSSKKEFGNNNRELYDETKNNITQYTQI